MPLLSELESSRARVAEVGVVEAKQLEVDELRAEVALFTSKAEESRTSR